MVVAARKKKKPEPGPEYRRWQARLKKLRDDLDITQEEAAARAGVSVSTWVSWENCNRRPSTLAQRLLKTAFPGQF